MQLFYGSWSVCMFRDHLYSCPELLQLTSIKNLFMLTENMQTLNYVCFCIKEINISTHFAQILLKNWIFLIIFENRKIKEKVK